MSCTSVLQTSAPSEAPHPAITEKLLEEVARDHGEALRRIVRLPEPEWMPLLSDELIRHIRRLHDTMDGPYEP